jgi:LPS export ABC transporter protein LptC
VIENFSVTESGEGKREWILEAREARVYERIGETRADSLRVRFFRKEDGTLYSTLRADQGRIDQASKDVTASGNVVVETDEGYRLETLSLTWIQKTGRIRTDDPIRLRKGRDLLTGTGFESDPSLRQYRIRSDVKAWIVDEKGNREEKP